MTVDGTRSTLVSLAASASIMINGSLSACGNGDTAGNRHVRRVDCTAAQRVERRTTRDGTARIARTPKNASNRDLKFRSLP
jgi:hypothetical protein